jgi:hypothetical protein
MAARAGCNTVSFRSIQVRATAARLSPWLADLLHAGCQRGRSGVAEDLCGRNWTFFFFAVEAHREEEVTAFSNAPTADMKAGDFSFGGVGNPLFDPATTRQLANGNWVRDPLPDRRVPLSRFDPVARKIIDIDPWVSPNRITTPNANGPVENILYGERARVFNEQYSGRIDHQIRANVKLNGTWTYNHSNGTGWPRNVRILISTPPTATPRPRTAKLLGEPIDRQPLDHQLNPRQVPALYAESLCALLVRLARPAWDSQYSNDLLPCVPACRSGGLTGGNAGPLSRFTGWLLMDHSGDPTRRSRCAAI